MSNYYNLHRAIELLKNEENEREAFEYLNKQLEETPYNADALLLRAILYGRQAEYDNALSNVNLAIKHYKKDCIFLQMLFYQVRAQTYVSIERYDKALADYETAYRVARKKSPEKIPDILNDRAEIYYKRNDYDRADADFHLTLKYDETNQAALLGLARNRMKQMEYSEALKLVNQCEKIDAKNELIYRHRMNIYDKMGKIDEAIDDAITYFDQSDDPDIESILSIVRKHLHYAHTKVDTKINNEKDDRAWKMLKAVFYEQEKDYARAIVEYNNIEKEYGVFAALYYYRSGCYDEIGDSEKAIADITKYIEIGNEKDFYAVCKRADMYRNGGRYAEAIADYTNALKINSAYVYPYYGRGWCYELSGDDVSAMKDYDTGIDMDKSYVYIFLMRGEQYLKQGDKEKAYADFETILAQDTTITSQSCRQYALHFLGRNKEALVWMDKIIENDPLDAGNYYDKSCLLARMGKLQESITALNRAFELGYRKFAHIEHDDDMNPLRNLPEFKTLIDEYKAKPICINTEIEQTGGITETISEIQMKKLYSGVYEVPCTINDLPLKFLFDTGASSVTISSVEASFMLKNDYLKEDDIKNKEYYSVATGEIREGTTIRLREIKIGDVQLNNIDALIIHNQQASLLLGQNVLERFGTITIDNINSKLIIKHK